MKSKHKHRRSNSTQITQNSQKTCINNDEQLCPTYEMVTLPSFSEQILECITKSEQKIKSKLTIVEDLHERLEGKRFKRLEDIEKDLKSWDQFQESFLNIRICKNEKPLCLREKKDKFRIYKHLQNLSDNQLVQPRNSFLKIHKKKSIRNK